MPLRGHPIRRAGGLLIVEWNGEKGGGHGVPPLQNQTTVLGNQPKRQKQPANDSEQDVEVAKNFQCRIRAHLLIVE